MRTKKKIDTLPDINKIVRYATYSMVSQVDGYLWKKVAEPQLVFSDREIKRIYKKRKKEFSFEYLNSPDQKTMKELLNEDTIIKNEEAFDNLVSKCGKNTEVKAYNRTFLYPFDEFEPFKDILYKMKPGEIKGPLSINKGIFIFHLKSTKDINSKPFRSIKDPIRSQMKFIKEIQIVENKQNEVFEKANIIINNKVEDIILEIAKNIYEDPSVVNSTDGHDTIMRYTLKGQNKYLLISDFIDYYTNDPFIFMVKDMESLHQTLKDYVIKQYLYDESEGLGILHEKKFLLDQKNFKNRLMVNHYHEAEFSDPVHISDQELMEFYQDKKEEFSEPQSCNVSIFTFENIVSAHSNLNYLNYKAGQDTSSGNFSDISALKGLISLKSDVKIKAGSKEYPDKLMQYIFGSPVNEVSKPFEMPDYSCIVFIKNKEEGMRIKNYEEVKDNILQRLKEEKSNALMINKIKELKDRYSMTVNKL